MTLRGIGIFSVVALVTATGCLGAARLPPFPDFGPATRVVVVGGNGGDTLHVFTHPADSARIAALVTFANARNNGWRVPWGGVPIPRVSAYFFGTRFQGHFGAGARFFETQRAGDFASRAANAAEIAEFARLLGVSLDALTGRTDP
jgi:hypothetical protein